MKAGLIAVVALVACGVSAHQTATEPLERLGRFDNVYSRTGEHCEGFSLDLWRSGTRLVGLLSRHQGLCGDPPCAAVEVRHSDSRTGRLRFRAVIWDEPISFSGFVQRGAVVGKLNGTSVRLNLEPPYAGVFATESVAEWCTFWQTVPRCTGVKELCQTLGR